MINRAIKVAERARSTLSSPTAIPIPAVTHIRAAVVKPETPYLERKIVPAPRKPIPGIICAAIREGSPILKVFNDCQERRANIQLPRLIRANVLILGSLPASSLSMPIIAPKTAAIISGRLKPLASSWKNSVIEAGENSIYGGGM